MAITFVGYYRPFGGAFTDAEMDGFRSAGQLADDFLEKVRALPAALAETCMLIGSWAPTGGVVPGVMVVEAESNADLAAISSHYFGWLQFDWHPVAAGGVQRTGPVT